MTERDAIRRFLTGTCIVVTMTLAIAAGLEMTARLTSGAWDGAAQDEEEGGLNQYVPYVEFRERAFASAALNVDSEGKRHVPGSCERGDAVTVMAFGGSTMFGAGVEDGHTIPAYLAAGFASQGRCVRVVNYGSSWWQSSQSLIQLFEVLRHGGRPQVVIFYDGINEVDAVGFGGAPGGIAPDIAAAFRQVFEPDARGWGRLARRSLVVRTLADGLLPSQHKDLHNDFVMPESGMPSAVTSLVEIYATNVRIAVALAKEYGFSAHFFLQPVAMLAGKPLTPAEEASMSERATARAWEHGLFRQAYRAFGAHPHLAGLSTFHDISGIFDGMTQDLYRDSEHLGPEGNRIVAERILRELIFP